MILRPRQETFVAKACDALAERGNTLGVAPTGAGKTVMLSAIAGRQMRTAGAKRVLVLQHRDELVSQNLKTFRSLNAGADVGVIDASAKQFHRDVMFAMVPTLSRRANMDALPPVDLVIADEAHHAAAKSWTDIINAIREKNPKAKLLGVTATPTRGDGKGLRGVFDNVSDQITLTELIRAGHLVRPRTFVVDVGVQDALREVRKTVTDFDMNAVAEIMDKEVLNDAVVKHWKEKAADRRTVVFASTVAHAFHVRAAFHDAGVEAAAITGEMAESDRRETLRAFDEGKIRVLVNVAVLTEGWDCPPVSCVVLLRPSSYKSTMIQMIGRGLRTVDPERYPGVVKSDCIVLDFGTSTLTHGSLEQEPNLDGKDKADGSAPTKLCPECQARVPISVRECAVCGHEFPEAPPVADVDRLADFAMTEVEIFNASPFKWVDLWDDGTAMMAAGIDEWVVCLNYQGRWISLGYAKDDGTGVRVVHVGEKLLALALADDFMRSAASEDTATKMRRWQSLPPTEKQVQYLQAPSAGMNRYKASCLLTWRFSERGIKSRVLGMAA
jgi:DNA repair protein RadD